MAMPEPTKPAIAGSTAPEATQRGQEPLANGSLPLLVVERTAQPAPAPGLVSRSVSLAGKLRYVPLLMALMMTGALVGMYFQPPGLKWVMRTFGLQPGGGTSNPIAVPVAKAPAHAVQHSPPAVVVALGKLVPNGDIRVVAPPFGAGDARIAALRVDEGSRVAVGDVLAVLDNEPPLKAAVAAAEAVVETRAASLNQIRAATRASADEARAALARAQAAALNTAQEYERVDALFKKGVSTAAAADARRAARDEAAREVDRLKVTLSRFAGDLDQQTDVVVARRNLDAAQADLERIRADLDKATVRAPIAGTVLSVHVRPGEKPGSQGILNLADIELMTVEAEVYQGQIGRVAIGAPVEITAEALAKPLQGTVRRIGLEVGRQTLLDPTPAANTDARVVKVTIELPKEASAIAGRFSNLQVMTRIAVEAKP
jgi:HlyD family secretion protein